MNDDDVVNAILSTRLLDKSRIKSSLYQHFPREIELFCKEILDPPKLVITFSSSRNCEIVKIDTQRYIIYDQYYGQSLNQLNTIAVSKDRENPLLNYGHKVLAEELRRRGSAKQALFHALFYAAEREDVQNQLADARLNSNKRGSYVAIQEVYVLAHELAHETVRSNEMLRSALIVENLNHINQTIWVKEKELLEGFGNDPEISEILNHKDLSLSDEEKELLVEGLGNDPEISEMLSHKDFFLSDEEKEGIAIEMACDDMAARFAFGFSQRLGVDFFISLEALWLGQLHLWWLSSLAYSASQFNKSTKQNFLLFNKELRSFRIRHDKMVATGFEIAFQVFPQNKDETWANVDRIYRYFLDNQYQDFLHSLEHLQKMLLNESSIKMVDVLLPRMLKMLDLKSDILETKEWIAVVDHATGWSNK